MFGGSEGSTSNQSMVPTLSNLEEWPEGKMLENEKEVLGMYISGHPLLKYADDLEEHSNFDFTEKLNPKVKIKYELVAQLQISNYTLIKRIIRWLSSS